MANNFIQTGKRVRIASATGAITVGTLVAQKALVGVALTSAASSGAFWLGIEGVWKIAVPASTVTGDYLAIPGANGVVTDATSPVVSRTPSNANTIFGRAITDRDSAGNAYVLLAAPAAYRASTQV